MTWTIKFKCGHKKQIQCVELPTKWQKKADKVSCPDCRKVVTKLSKEDKK